MPPSHSLSVSGPLHSNHTLGQHMPSSHKMWNSFLCEHVLSNALVYVVIAKVTWSASRPFVKVNPNFIKNLSVAFLRCASVWQSPHLHLLQQLHWCVLASVLSPSVPQCWYWVCLFNFSSLGVPNATVLSLDSIAYDSWTCVDVVVCSTLHDLHRRYSLSYAPNFHLHILLLSLARRQIKTVLTLINTQLSHFCPLRINTYKDVTADHRAC